MDSAISKITETVSDAVKNANEVVRERLFSPMYFYFIIAWIITNWKFVYVLLFVDETTIIQGYRMLKVDYLAQMYRCDWWSSLQLFVIPAITTLVVVWLLSWVSEKFFEKHEKHLMNKRVIKRTIEYGERYQQIKEEKKIREDAGEKEIKYTDNADFNDFLDEGAEEIKVSALGYAPSEVIYNTDYQAYLDQLNDWRDNQAQKGEDLAVQAEIDRRRGK